MGAVDRVRHGLCPNDVMAPCLVWGGPFGSPARCSTHARWRAVRWSPRSDDMITLQCACCGKAVEVASVDQSASRCPYCNCSLAGPEEGEAPAHSTPQGVPS